MARADRERGASWEVKCKTGKQASGKECVRQDYWMLTREGGAKRVSGLNLQSGQKNKRLV